MPFSIRPHRRFPVCCPVTYHAGLSEGQGTVWNISLNGWRLSGALPLRIGQSFPMTVALSDQESIFVAAGIVRWVRGAEYGVETLVADHAALNQITRFVKQQVGLELTPSHGGHDGLNIAAMDSLYRSARSRTPYRPSHLPDPD